MRQTTELLACLRCRNREIAVISRGQGPGRSWTLPECAVVGGGKGPGGSWILPGWNGEGENKCLFAHARPLKGLADSPRTLQTYLCCLAVSICWIGCSQKRSSPLSVCSFCSSCLYFLLFEYMYVSSFLALQGLFIPATFAARHVCS